MSKLNSNIWIALILSLVLVLICRIFSSILVYYNIAPIFLDQDIYIYQTLLSLQGFLLTLFIAITVLILKLTASIYSFRTFEAIMKPQLFTAFFLLVFSLIADFCFLICKNPDKIFFSAVLVAMTTFMILNALYGVFRDSQPKKIIEHFGNSLKFEKEQGNNFIKHYEEALLCISDIVYPSIKRFDIVSSREGLKHTSESMKNLKKSGNIEDNNWNDLSKNYSKLLTRYGRIAIEQDDEGIVKDIIEIHLEFIKWHLEHDDESSRNGSIGYDNKTSSFSNYEEEKIRSIFSYQINPIIDSLSDIGISAVESGLGRATQEALEKIYICGILSARELIPFDGDSNPAYLDYLDKLNDFNENEQKYFKDIFKIRDNCTNKTFCTDENLKYDNEISKAVINAAWSISIISQIAARKNYEEIVIRSTKYLGHIGYASCYMRKDNRTNSNIFVPSRVIWKIKDAGIAAADQGLEGATIRFTEVLAKVAECAAIITTKENTEENVNKGTANNGNQTFYKNKLAQLCDEIATGIREIGQVAAENKLENGVIKISVHLGQIGKICFTNKISYESANSSDIKHPIFRVIWCLKDVGKICSDNDISYVSANSSDIKYPIFRVIWCLKDVGKAAAKNGIEKGSVRFIERLYEILKYTSDDYQASSDKEREILLQVMAKSYVSLREIWRVSSLSGLEEAQMKALELIKEIAKIIGKKVKSKPDCVTNNNNDINKLLCILDLKERRTYWDSFDSNNFEKAYEEFEKSKLNRQSQTEISTFNRTNEN